MKLGADASAAAGPKGRDAEAATDVTVRAEVLTYSRSRGLFAGISLEGSTLRPDDDANERIYGRKIEAKEIALHGAVPIPASAKGLIATTLIGWATVSAELVVAYVIYIELRESRLQNFIQRTTKPKATRNEAIYMKRI